MSDIYQVTTRLRKQQDDDCVQFLENQTLPNTEVLKICMRFWMNHNGNGDISRAILGNYGSQSANNMTNPVQSNAQPASTEVKDSNSNGQATTPVVEKRNAETEQVSTQTTADSSNGTTKLPFGNDTMGRYLGN